MASLSELQAARHREEAERKRKEEEMKNNNGMELEKKEERTSPIEEHGKIYLFWSNTYRNMSRVLPRSCIKTTIFIFGVLSIIVAVLGLVGSILQLVIKRSRQTNYVSIVFGFINCIPLILAGICFIVSSLKKDTRRKCDGFFAFIGLSLFIIVCILALIGIFSNLVVGIILSFVSPRVEDDKRGVSVIAVVVSSIISLVGCCICCFPCVFTGIVNVMHLFPPKKKEEGEEISREEEEKEKEEEEEFEEEDGEEDIDIELKEELENGEPQPVINRPSSVISIGSVIVDNFRYQKQLHPKLHKTNSYHQPHPQMMKSVSGINNRLSNRSSRNNSPGPMSPSSFRSNNGCSNNAAIDMHSMALGGGNVIIIEDSTNGDDNDSPSSHRPPVIRALTPISYTGNL